MAFLGEFPWLNFYVAFAALMLQAIFVNADDIYLEWQVNIDTTIKPVLIDQPVITINGMFPGPLINATTNDIIHVNVFNNMDEPLLITCFRNGIQQRLNSWQDGVSGTNCPIRPGSSWTYVFTVKDQIGTFSYFPSINFHKAGGAFGPIRVNPRVIIPTPFPKPHGEFDLLIGDWYNNSFKVPPHKHYCSIVSRSSHFIFPKIRMNSDIRSSLNKSLLHLHPDTMLMNGNSRYPQTNRTIVVEQGHFCYRKRTTQTFYDYFHDKNEKNIHWSLYSCSASLQQFFKYTGETYLIRISNVGTERSINFRIQNHPMLLVETEGSYISQIILDTLDIHVGQSYSVLVTTNQPKADYYMVASPKMVNTPESSQLIGVGVLHYDDSTTPVQGPLPRGPDPFDLNFSINQAKSIRWNLTAGAARPNPQGTFNVSNVTLSQTFILQGSLDEINGSARYAVNNVSYRVPDTALKLADYYKNGTGTYKLDAYSANSSNPVAIDGTFVVSGVHNGWLEIVFKNDMLVIDTWHLDGFGFYVVGFGAGDWTPNMRSTYNLYDPVVRSTVQVYPGGWTAVYAYLDNPGMWNLRSQVLKHWYLGQELYIRVYDPDPNPAKERQPPSNILFCGSVIPPPVPTPTPPTPVPVPPGPKPSPSTTLTINWFSILLIFVFALL
ncbi:L-ascorbate oxidase homolog [Lactuca sativa]|uniref:L-ascorbate oxidase homolog n=1 Tax=Lactuca sativa TaxID=4236 RepID=UPI001C693D49|nr:L-ascorbate oxidase homolog [Lactuca sativa]